MLPYDLAPIANHLWQSTLCVGAAWLLTLVLSKHRAAARYWIWLAASAKFVLPFSWLVSAGSRIGQNVGPAMPPAQVVNLITGFSRPFDVSAPISALTASPDRGAGISIFLLGVWLCGLIAGLVFWILKLREVRAVVRVAEPLPLGLPIPVLSAPDRFEPSVVGIWKPVLILPDGITERLSPAQLEAVLAHELCHVRRRDNLTAAIHMAVETIFWFHPLVWWIRTQLIAERERACDEEVVEAVGDPSVYADSILNVCRHYLESPLKCAAGVASADLKRRIERIMDRRIARKLDLPKKLLLTAAGLASVAAPVMIGLLNAPVIEAQQAAPAADPPISYEASIRPNNTADARTISEYFPGGRFAATAVTVNFLLRNAYRIQPYQLVGAPAWITTRRFDIAAKVETTPPPPQQVFLRALLRDRFKLELHNEKRELPIFELVHARSDGKLGSQLTKSDFDCAAYMAKPHAPPEPGRTPSCATRINLGLLSGRAIPMTQLAASLAPLVNRFTVDKTSLAGGYDVELTWTPPQQGSPDPPSGPSIFTALQEQLGLKLNPGKGPVDVLVVDRLEEPSEN